MTRIQDLRLLELDVEANWADVEEAYRCLMRRYSIGGLASYGLLRVEDRRRFLLMLQEAYQRCKASENLPVEMIRNEVSVLYDQFEYCQVSKRIAEIVTPEGIIPEVHVIFQTIEGLHQATPQHSGDWYFSGRYPTPGGNRVVNRAFMNFVENVDARAY